MMNDIWNVACIMVLLYISLFQISCISLDNFLYFLWTVLHLVRHCAVQFAFVHCLFSLNFVVCTCCLFGILNYAACLAFLTMQFGWKLCILFNMLPNWFSLQDNFLSLFVNQEPSCDLQRGRTNWFRPITFNDEFFYD